MGFTPTTRFIEVITISSNRSIQDRYKIIFCCHLLSLECTNCQSFCKQTKRTIKEIPSTWPLATFFFYQVPLGTAYKCEIAPLQFTVSSCDHVNQLRLNFRFT